MKKAISMIFCIIMLVAFAACETAPAPVSGTESVSETSTAASTPEPVTSGAESTVSDESSAADVSEDSVSADETSVDEMKDYVDWSGGYGTLGEELYLQKTYNVLLSANAVTESYLRFEYSGGVSEPIVSQETRKAMENEFENTKFTTWDYQKPFVIRCIEAGEFTKEQFTERNKAVAEYLKDHFYGGGPEYQRAFTDDEIEVLFSGDCDLIKRTFKHRSALYYNGYIYDIDVLARTTDDALLRELWDAGVLEPYCDDMIENLAPWRDDYRQRFQEIKEKFSA